MENEPIRSATASNSSDEPIYALIRKFLQNYAKKKKKQAKSNLGLVSYRLTMKSTTLCTSTIIYGQKGNFIRFAMFLRHYILTVCIKTLSKKKTTE